jgi:ADP-dependent NAD(P)H-hydrate dehydratase / NAD(P)H-hydrate epimerase
MKMKLVTVAEMRAIEREADASGWSYSQMMEQAGSGLAEMVQSYYSFADDRVAIALVGSGNNGGDTLVALTVLIGWGWSGRAFLVRPRKDDPLLERFLAAGGDAVEMEADAHFERLGSWFKDATVLLDGVLGTGFQLPLKADVGEVLRFTRDAPFLPPVVAVDCPSGVDCDSGEVADQVIPAEVTVCMAAVKMGLLKFPAFRLVGDLQVVEIGLPEDLPSWQNIQHEVVGDARVREILPIRPADGHKGTFGTAVIAAGSLNYTGAVLLAGRACARVGTGLVTLAVAAPLHSVLAGQLAEATWILLPHQMGAISGEAVGVLVKGLERASVLLVGPGLGVEDCSAEFIRRLLEGSTHAERAPIGFVTEAQTGRSEKKNQRLPAMVVDADGLRLMARIPDWMERLPAQSILTPHPGEMSALCGLSREEIQANRIETARLFAARWGHVVVLKGAFTVIAAPDGRLALIPAATSALAHAGTGDVLAGMITGLRAQGIPPYEAALAGAWLHAQAALTALERLGHEASILAGDVVESIPEVLALVWER